MLLGYQSFAGKDSDNTKINQRDSSANEITAEQQSENPNDISISSRIRKHIMKEKDLSTYAQNIKIITVDGKVTLKGPVLSEREQKSLMKCARQVAGTANVTNKMSIATNN